MGPWRRTSWFAVSAMFLAFWMGVLGSLPHDALGGVIPSRGSESIGGRNTDLRRLERLLETEIARQKLEDFGVPAHVARAKLRKMSDQDLHVLASMADRIPEGGSEPFPVLANLFLAAFIVGTVILIILVILGVIGIGALARHLKKSRTQQQRPE